MADATVPARPPRRVPHNRLTFGDEEARAAADAVRSGYWSTGPRVAELERALATAAGVEHAVCVGSGLAALRLSLLALGVGKGHRVVVPGYSCVALANAALACDAEPLPVDVLERTWNLDTDRALTLRPNAILAVHTFGAVCVTPARSAVPVVEDCSHAFGFSEQGRAIGGRTQVSIISLHATKLVGCGEGGAVMTDDARLAGVVRERRDYADAAPDGRRLNDKMTDVAAAIALCQLARLPEMLGRRADLAARYDDQLKAAASGAYRLPDQGGARAWYRYAVEATALGAPDLVARLAARGVAAAEPVADWRRPDDPACPVASRAYRTLVSLPLYPTLTHQEQDQVIHAFLDCCRTLA